MYFFKTETLFYFILKYISIIYLHLYNHVIPSQCPEINFDKASNTIYKIYIGLISMLQGFQKCIA